MRALALLKASGRVAEGSVLMKFGYLDTDSTFAREDADIRFVPRFKRADGSATEGIPHLLNPIDFFTLLCLPNH